MERACSLFNFIHVMAPWTSGLDIRLHDFRKCLSREFNKSLLMPSLRAPTAKGLPGVPVDRYLSNFGLHGMHVFGISGACLFPRHVFTGILFFRVQCSLSAPSLLLLLLHLKTRFHSCLTCAHRLARLDLGFCVFSTRVPRDKSTGTASAMRAHLNVTSDRRV